MSAIISLDNKKYYKISNSQNLNPFFIQIVSASDVWVFLSSKGGITAGRKNSQGAFFPYETDDRLHKAYETGSKTLIRINNSLWEPFERCNVKKWNTTQNIYKGIYGSSIMFEEINHELDLSFSYIYEISELYGIVKTSNIKNLSNKEINLEILDGILNILPYGVNEGLLANTSTLVDAYRSNELIENKLALYSMTTLINDTPNPIEVLKANIAWTTKPDATVYLDDRIIKSFCENKKYIESSDSYGRKGAYLVLYDAIISANGENTHSIVMDTGYDHSKIVELSSFLNKSNFASLYSGIEEGTEQLKHIVAESDGIQSGGEEVVCTHHFMNTLYNVMRGGTFEDIYTFKAEDFLSLFKIEIKKLQITTSFLRK